MGPRIAVVVTLLLVVVAVTLMSGAGDEFAETLSEAPSEPAPQVPDAPPIDAAPTSAVERRSVEVRDDAPTTTTTTERPPDPEASSEARSFFGRIVRTDDSTPILGATIAPRDGTRPAVTTDFDGRFVWPLESRVVTLQVAAEGFGTTLVRPTKRHERADHAREIRLPAGATLRVRLDDPRREFATRVVRLSTPPYNIASGEFVFGDDVTFSTAIDARGRGEITDLPPAAPFRAEVLDDGELRQRVTPDLVFEAGETRDVRWTIGEGARIVGLLRGGSREGPLRGREVWLLHDVLGGNTAAARGFAYSGDDDRVVARDHTDDAGRFVFEDVLPGTYWIAPRPSRDHSPAQVVVVPAGIARVDVTMTVPNLRITGNVLGPDGARVAEAHVSVFCPELGASTSFRVKNDGSFESERLWPGTYLVVARSWKRFAPSEPVEVAAGARGVDLRLRRSVGLSGVVVDDTTGAPVRASVTLTDSSRTVMWSGPNPTGAFSFSNLAPGAIHLSAAAPEGMAAPGPSFILAPGEQRDGIEIRVRPGARVEVHYDGPGTYANYTVSRGETVFAADGLHTGTRATAVVPANTPLRVTMSLRGRDDEQVEDIELAPGERRELSFTFEGD